MRSLYVWVSELLFLSFFPLIFQHMYCEPYFQYSGGKRTLFLCLRALGVSATMLGEALSNATTHVKSRKQHMNLTH